MSECIFCKLAKGELPTEKLYEDEHAFVIKDIRPKAPTHLLVIPHKHVEKLSNLEENDQALMGHIMCSMKQFAAKAGLEHFRVIINNGEGAGQEVFHLHLHILGGPNGLPGF